MRSEPRGRSILPAFEAGAAVGVLGPPRLPPATAADVPLACRAAASAIPVLLAAPAAGGRLLLARALHALAARSGPLVAATGRRPALEGLPPGATLYVDVPGLGPEAALALEALLDDATVWVLAGAEPGAALPGPLAARLRAVVLSVPALHDRREEIPALATAVLASLARRRGTAPPRVAPAALERLTAHAWPGDLAELESILARAMLSAPADVIEAEHLALELGPPPPLPPPGREESDTSAPLEFLLAELAHELRNPMVTIKTYAQHLPTLLEDADLRARFESLTGEAIERMDGLLENVLAFARLAPPRREAVAVAPLLERVLGDLHPALAGRAVRVRHTAAPAASCTVDPDHLAFALRNLLAGVVREVPPREELALEATANGVVTLRFAAGGEALERLRRLAAPGGAANDMLTLSDPTLLPLPFRLARAVLERNGATLAVVPEMGAATTVVIRLPTAPEGA